MHAYQHDRLNPQTAERTAIGAFAAKNKALCGGALLSLTVMGTIFVNAIWYQPDRHPSPLFSTRDVVAPAKLSAKNKAVQPQKPAASQIASVSPEVLREVQSALSVRGYYGGKIDGKFGSRTKKAILDFQRDHSLQQDGHASVRLLSQVLLSASASPDEVPVPSRLKIAQSPVKVKTVKISTEPETSVLDGLVAQIQAGLRNYGYDDLVVDGKAGSQTKTAIQRFQLDYGMKITGEPSERVLDKLREIGAYKQG